MPQDQLMTTLPHPENYTKINTGSGVGGHAWFHSKISHTIRHSFRFTSSTAGSLALTTESSELGRPLSSQALSKPKDPSPSLHRLHLDSWGDRGTVNLQTPKRRKSAVTDPTGSPYENQARERHNTSTRRDIPLFKATGTTTSPARTPRV